MSSEILKKINWEPKWDGGAPLPQVFSNGHKTYLTYIVADWDHESVSEIIELDETEQSHDLMALVEFDGGTFRFGIANDEVFPGLPFYKQGIEWAQIIENSKWINEIKEIHKVHPHFRESNWNNLDHYLLTFKDELFEILASDYKIDVFKTTSVKLGQEVIKRMNKN